MIHSLSRIHTGYAQFSADWYLSPKWMFKANASVNLNAVNSYDKYDKTGYDKQRAEASLFATAKYRPAKGLSFAADLRRRELRTAPHPADSRFFRRIRPLAAKRAWSSKLRSRATSATRRSTTSISCPAATIRCGANGVSPMTEASKRDSKRDASPSGARRPSTIRKSKTGSSGFRRPRLLGRRAT